jgi:hypothetical protein
MKIEDFIGVTHAGAKYGFGTINSLCEGALRVQELGSKTIKLFFCPGYDDLYRFNTQWDKHDTLISLAQSDYFRQVFDMDFHTFILETFPLETQHFGHWRENFSDEFRDAEYKAIYETACYFLTTYQGTNKTFIFQNWETDWAILEGSKLGDREANPEPQAIKNCINWTNTRQNAVNQARKDSMAEGVQVYHALEVNNVGRAVNGKPCVTNSVVPHTYCDLYSYSAYDTTTEGQGFEDALDYLLATIPPSATLGKKNLFLGEFGVPNNEVSDEKTVEIIDWIVRLCREKGLRHAVYWELYDNVAVEGKSDEPGDCTGYWLIKPSGAKAVTWHYFYDHIHGGTIAHA